MFQLETEYPAEAVEEFQRGGGRQQNKPPHLELNWEIKALISPANPRGRPTDASLAHVRT